jgi:hypothetical protein
MFVALPEGPCRPVTPASQQPDEGSPERPVEHCVYDGVDGRGDVSQPEARVNHMVWNVAVWTRSEDDIEDEEGSPTQNEGEENQTQHFGCFLFRGYCVGGQRASPVSSSYEPESRKLKHCQFIVKVPACMLPRRYCEYHAAGFPLRIIKKALPSTFAITSSNTDT